MRRGAWWAVGLVVIMVVALAWVAPVRRLGGRFFDSLRIARPERVSVTLPSPGGPAAGRLIENMVAGMVAETAAVAVSEPDSGARTAAAAAARAGFAPALARARRDAPTLTVTGARSVELAIRTSQLRTILAEAGFTGAAVGAALEGTRLAIRTPRGIRAQYGHCPQPAPATIAGQLNGPPPTTTDNSDCIVLTQNRPDSVDAPPGLPLGDLVEVALELSGLSPDQARDVRATFDARTVLSMALPRFIRSFQPVRVGPDSARGVLLGMGFRRGPTYELIWTSGGVLHTLAGYGSSGDAVPLAASLAPAAEARR